MLPTSAYDTLSNTTLHSIQEQLEKIQPTHSDLKNSVLTVKVEGLGEYVFNRQPPLQQIWVSSPVSGVCRFVVDGNVFVGTKSRIGIHEYVEQEIGRIVRMKKDSV